MTCVCIDVQERQEMDGNRANKRTIFWENLAAKIKDDFCLLSYEPWSPVLDMLRSREPLYLSRFFPFSHTHDSR